MICTVTGCEQTATARGYCAAHRKRLRKYGDVFAEIPLGACPGSRSLRDWWPDSVAVQRALEGSKLALSYSERVQAMVILRDQGLSGPEIADRLGCAPTTVWRNLRLVARDRAEGLEHAAEGASA